VLVAVVVVNGCLTENSSHKVLVLFVDNISILQFKTGILDCQKIAEFQL